ncbi:MAG: M3 family oligoendopeptidase [Turicibacter sp.]|nr:M3 family oligoendopeptidase [Turicibacter sp.]
MKFSQMQYNRPNVDEIAETSNQLTAELAAATTAEQAFAVYEKYDDFSEKTGSMFNLAEIRHTLDTTNEFYATEKDFIDEYGPKAEELHQKWTETLLKSQFRPQMEEKWGNLMFLNAEIELKTFKPEIIEDLQEENRLITEYDKLMASAQIDFDGKKLTLAQMGKYAENPDRKIREDSIRATAGWRMNQAAQLDEIYDKLVKIRTKIAQTLGHEKFTQVGYYRMQRNCYDKEMVAKFRDGVKKYIVPIVTKLKAEQAARIGVDRIKFYDNAFEYPDGNATPKGTPEEIFAHGKKMYHELSPETAEFIDFMLENELFDVITRPGKSPGGYCSTLPEYKAPFIFANFNGTSGDIDVLTHEAGHALAAHIAMNNIKPSALQEYSAETAEIHSMSMEFFTWPWMKGFFAEQTDKYYYSHLASALIFIPYGTMVDEFQHIMYENPQLTPAERHQEWLKLEAQYRPWLDLSDIPYISEGRMWQAQLHIYLYPFYYIDYCLAQIMALSFWAIDQKNHSEAWQKYLRLLSLAGTKTFVDLIGDAGLPTPFVADNLKLVSDAALEWLNKRK